jgi:chromosome segregation ATPase
LARGGPEAFVIESIMFFGVGFLCASLLGLIILPLVHGRAARLTARRLEASSPVSMAEVQADKDQLRAEFAISTRRLEMSVEHLKARSTTQLGELGKKTEAIAVLKHELGEKSAALAAMEAHVKSLHDKIGTTEEELVAKSTTANETARALADMEGALSKLNTEIGEHTATTGAARVEILNLHTQIDSLKAQLTRNEQDVKDAQARLTRQRGDADAASKELSDERGKAESLTNRVAQLERQLVAQTTEAEILNRRIQDLEARLTAQGIALIEREHATNQLRSELDAAKKNAADLLAELSKAGGRQPATNGRADTTQVHAELARVTAERANLQQEIAVMKRDSAQAWTDERVENALLRERINDIAAEVANLTMALEGANSPIEAILAADAPPSAANGNEAPSGNLADRIRALQSRASRLQPVS